MENQDKDWREIRALIERDKAAALAEFRRRPLRIAEGISTRRPPVSRLRPALRPAALAAAALLLAAGLASFWLWRGNWRIAPAAPMESRLLAGSFLYGPVDPSPAAGGGGAAPEDAAPLFADWAAAGMERLAAAGVVHRRAAVDPEGVVEHADPEEVRRRIERAIQEGAFEQWLQNMIEINNQEA